MRHWCPKTMKWRSCWCSKPILWEVNSFLMLTLSFVLINLRGCGPREWKRFVWKIKVSYHISGKQGWRSGESARLPPMWPEFDSGPVPYEGWVCCWFSPCSEGFSLGLRFSSLHKKTNISKFQFNQDRRPAWKPAKADVTSSLNIVIYLFIFM